METTFTSSINSLLSVLNIITLVNDLKIFEILKYMNFTLKRMRFKWLLNI